MTTTFLNRHLEELYETGRSRKYRLQSDVIARFIDRVNILKAAETIHDLQRQTSLNFERLSGSNLHSIRVNRKYRVEFTMDWTNEERTIGIAGITELSNHYGD